MSIERAQRYVELSNEGKLSEALEMFAENATYESSQVGSFVGRAAIGKMMRGFFERFRQARWDVESYRETSPDEVEFTFVMTAVSAETGERIERRGAERITFDEAGSITHVDVAVDPT
jgi:hypothetical protein